jgi:hypothetical protein
MRNSTRVSLHDGKTPDMRRLKLKGIDATKGKKLGGVGNMVSEKAFLSGCSASCLFDGRIDLRVLTIVYIAHN